MPVSAADPGAVKLDEAFAKAMDTPGAPREPGPPPEVDKDAPFGRGDDGIPLAPFGLTRAGKPKLSAAGRKRTEDQARVGQAQGKDTAGKPDATAAEPKRYAPGIAETMEVFWLGGTVLGQVGPEIPVIGKLLPDPVKMQAQAAVILTFKDNIAGALDICAQHNEQARRLAVKLSAGNAGWALNAAFMILPVITTSLRIWGNEERQLDPETSEPLPTLAEQLAGQNAVSFKAYMADLAARAAEATAAAAEQAHEAVHGQPAAA